MSLAALHSQMHSVRHFFAATPISAGYDIDAVSKALGHSSVAITSLIYSSLFEAAKAKMAGMAESCPRGDLNPHALYGH
jgi:site-specific recombinase XerD